MGEADNLSRPALTGSNRSGGIEKEENKSTHITRMFSQGINEVEFRDLISGQKILVLRAVADRWM
ncbi:MAG: hypothetical protein Q7K33_00190 [Candidatus Berkelbacteria bacterium]|nr:hypothetical protein [Candidatus Berkelbacteria bacterium]